MLLASIAILAGFIGLIWSADQFVAGAAGIARNLGMTPIMIGLTIVALGTSAPEIIVSINAAMAEAGDLAIGNAIGSNIANIGLVLGVTAIIAPIPIAYKLLKREVPLLLVATFGAGFLLFDNVLSKTDGIILLALLAVIFAYLIFSRSHQPDAEHEADVEHVPDLPLQKAWLLFFVGLAILIISSRILVWGAQDIARSFGVSELIIGLTIIAVGTSLPELAASAASALKGHHDIAIGNVIGSNLFNLLAVMAMPALIEPGQLDPSVLTRDYSVMTFITLLLVALIMAHKLRNGKKENSKPGFIGRMEGALLLLSYGAYYYFLFPSVA